MGMHVCMSESSLVPSPNSVLPVECTYNASYHKGKLAEHLGVGDWDVETRDVEQRHENR